MLNKYYKILTATLIVTIFFAFSALVAFAQTTTRSDFNLTSMCKPSEKQGSLRIRNNSEESQTYILSLYGDDTTYTGTANAGDTLQTVTWNLSSDTWILQIAGYSFTKAIGNNPLCESPTPTPTPSPEVTPAPQVNTGGPGDGLGCSTHDCSGNQVGGPSTPANTQTVLGAATGPQVLGLSTTSGEENYLLQIAQAAGALISGGLGLIFFKKNA